MTISKLIANLQKVQKEQGDLDVWYKTHDEEELLDTYIYNGMFVVDENKLIIDTRCIY